MYVLTWVVKSISYYGARSEEFEKHFFERPSSAGGQRWEFLDV